MPILIFFAILSGIVTFLSPCILPILPIVLASSATTQKSRPLGLISGLIVSFSVFTLLITKIISFFGFSAEALRLLSVVFLVIIGLSMAIPVLTIYFEQILSVLPRLVKHSDTEGSGFWQGFLTGASLGLIWAPCAGPILSAVIIVTATQTLSLNSALIIFAFSIGVGIPLLAVTYGGRAFIQRVRFLSGNLQRIQQLFGVLVILTAILIGLNLDTQITAWLTNVIPAGWTAALDSFESAPIVRQQLDALGGNGALSPTSDAALAVPGRYGPAADFSGATNWINSPPLSIRALQGKVVLVDFWTYSCINCIRTFPYLTDWYNKYKDYGFVIIGVHAPEFAFEQDTANVQRAASQFGLLYPVAQDNNYLIWNAYGNNYWPAEYLIDAQGLVRHVQEGEGNYAETEKAIQELLAEAGHPVSAALTKGPPLAISYFNSPETYIGTERLWGLASPESVKPGIVSSYTIPETISRNNFAVSGQWDFEPQFAQEQSAGSQITLHFFAQDVYLVMTSDQPVLVKVSRLIPDMLNSSEDLNPQSAMTVSESRLYHLVRLEQASDATITLTFTDPGVRLFSFTFG
jgi:cytochrome c biogenesis protein CcdA/thiol-disulfide isomerase/thioredoxin